MYQHHYSDKQKDFCDSQRFRYQFKADLALVPNVYVVNDNKLILYQFMYIMHTMLIVCFWKQSLRVFHSFLQINFEINEERIFPLKNMSENVMVAHLFKRSKVCVSKRDLTEHTTGKSSNFRVQFCLSPM